jgi:hypothetical protein
VEDYDRVEQAIHFVVGDGILREFGVVAVSESALANFRCSGGTHRSPAYARPCDSIFKFRHSRAARLQQNIQRSIDRALIFRSFPFPGFPGENTIGSALRCATLYGPLGNVSSAQSVSANICACVDHQWNARCCRSLPDRRDFFRLQSISTCEPRHPRLHLRDLVHRSCVDERVGMAMSAGLVPYPIPARRDRNAHGARDRETPASRAANALAVRITQHRRDSRAGGRHGKSNLP